MRSAHALVCASLAVLFSLPAQAQALTLKEESPLRKVDRTGEIVGSYIWGMAIPEIGVGNVIFSSSAVPYMKEATYTNVGTRFDVTQAPALFYRQYQPARNSDMIAFILAKHPEYKFVKKFEIIEMKGPKATVPYQAVVTIWLASDSMPMSTTWNQFWPTNDYKYIDVRKRALAEKGTHSLRVGHYLQFDTGKVKIIEELKDGKLIKESRPILRDVAVAYGTCEIVNP